MINFILIMLAIILSPVLIICAFISLVLIVCIIIAIVSIVATSISELIDYVSNMANKE